MGISGLTSLLNPYAEPIHFTGEREAPLDLFIDGPGLAYFCWNALPRFLKVKSGSEKRRGDYGVFLQRVDLVLEKLEQSGDLKISKIYFDGHLPPAKLSTRQQRLARSLHQLNSYRNLHTTSHTRIFPHLITSPDNQQIFIAVPPFLVSVLIDHLQTSRWRDTIETVPGEADGFLAEGAVRTGGCVLTSDSDLLCFNPASGKHKEWSVMMFRDLSFQDGFKGRIFHPARMEERMDVRLSEIAYELTLAGHSTSLHQIKQQLPHRQRGVAYQRFISEYFLPDLPKAHIPAPLGPHLKHLTPRLSELVFQLQPFSAFTFPAPTSLPSSKEQQVVSAFHPLLWDDPQRFPAYDAGTSIRAAAYSLLPSLSQSTPREFIVKEYNRRGPSIGTVDIHTLDREALKDYLAALLPSLSSLPACLLRIWLTPYLERGNALPPTKALVGVLRCTSGKITQKPSKPTARWTWDQSRWFGGWQAAVYSLYLLREVCRLVKAAGAEAGERDDEIREGAEAVCESLRAWDPWAWIDGEAFLEGCNGEMTPGEKGVVEEVLAWARSLEDQDDGEDEDEEDGGEDNGSGEVDGNTLDGTELQEDQKDDSQLNSWHSPKRKRAARPKEMRQERSAKLAKGSQNPFDVLEGME